MIREVEGDGAPAEITLNTRRMFHAFQPFSNNPPDRSTRVHTPADTFLRPKASAITHPLNVPRTVAAGPCLLCFWSWFENIKSVS